VQYIWLVRFVSLCTFFRNFWFRINFRIS
jgi:hypothetical protein